MTYCWWGASGLHQGVCESAVTMTTGSLLWPGILPWLDSRGRHRREAPELCDMVALPEMPAPSGPPEARGVTQPEGAPSALSPSQGLRLLLYVGKASLHVRGPKDHHGVQRFARRTHRTRRSCCARGHGSLQWKDPCR